MAYPWKVAWITGASSGIGAEIALQLAQSGVKVAASARSLPENPLHANISHYSLDVTVPESVSAAVEQIERELGPIDLAVFSAGAYVPFSPTPFSIDNFTRVNTVNYLGVVHCIAALLPRYMSRRAGYFAWVASVAGYQGLPKAAYYGPTKAALINLAEALWMELRPHGIDISVINPGFVETPMTAANDFPMPFLINPERAAALTIAGLAARRFEIAYPFRFVLILKVLSLLPRTIKLRLISRFTL
jgi:NAD(P)-dependent dehydrogenase (short-subunit alcohol dehydrogenase family)